MKLTNRPGAYIDKSSSWGLTVGMRPMQMNCVIIVMARQRFFSMDSYIGQYELPTSELDNGSGLMVDDKRQIGAVYK